MILLAVTVVPAMAASQNVFTIKANKEHTDATMYYENMKT
ncbi:hypothetical protein Mtc_0344 [Methanocella conradii HZ254]|uniref:Uncharacterized protein n=1 Tax=Methanocella conradii (strain DSM 24694 / JCM 17849 / CGMCC 1.5162 / HZ254) TaxID=1041930 RepID=H8IA48_METCZ|nr:hypothetical protein Mtc_0344 [Methanocella conradii HZ254]